MKIRFTKANGTQMEISDVAGVEIVEAGLVSIVRSEPLDVAERSFRFEPNGAGSGISIFDRNIPWPLPPVVIG
jgi:hypothetical protein